MSEQNFPLCPNPDFSAMAWMLRTAAEDISYWHDEENWEEEKPEYAISYAALLALAED